MVNVWFAPPATLTDPDGEMDPPTYAEAEIVYVLARLNAALTLRLDFMVTLHVLAVPEHAPDQPAKEAPGPGVAVRVTSVPELKVVPDGLVVTVPVPVPLLVTVSV